MLAPAVLELAELVPLLVLERRMKRTGGPGIIPFELAGRPERAQWIMARWGTEGRAAARRSLQLDFLFPITYGPLHALGCAAAAESFSRRGHGRLAAAGPLIAWAQLAAPAFDYVENVALLLVLSDRDPRLSAAARIAALARFGCLIPGWSYLLLSSFDRAVSARNPRTREP